VGPMDVRLENIHTDAPPSNYVSFLNQAQRKKIKGGDRDSIHSVSSMRSVMSTMTSLWSSLGLSSKSASKLEKSKAQEKEDLKYLYSAFTKVPCLKLAPDYKAPLIAGYEEFPFDTAVPVFVFKNVSALEICDVDFRQFYGWDRVADTVRSLSLKRASIDDPADLLINIVLDDMDKRRRRSAKTATSPIVGAPSNSPGRKHAQLADTRSAPPSPRQSHVCDEGPVSSSLESRGSHHPRRRSASPSRPGSSRYGSSSGYARSNTPIRRSSGSSTSSLRAQTPRGSSSTLLTMGYLPMSKWSFLRHLSLSDNSLTTISAASLAPVANTLQSLDLSSNLFTEIPDSLASLVALRALNLSHCMINSLHSLVRNPLPAITALNLRANRLASLAGIERLLSLERVDLRENRLNDPTEIARLTGIPDMVDIYVYKNPFVKNYSNYRITIFNLFRSTPGYTEDIFIDGTQPAYSEKKFLADRAPEPPTPPVIKPPIIQEDLSYARVHPMPAPTPPPSIGSEGEYRIERRGSELGHHRRKSEYGSTQRRKKGTRRRIVDIAQADMSAEPRRESLAIDTAVLKPSPLPEGSLHGYTNVDFTIPIRSSSTRATVTAAAPERQSQALPMEAVSPSILRTGSDPIARLDPPITGEEGELYRQKIEALRHDFGNGWLSALSDETWDPSPRSSGYDGTFSPPGPLTPPAGPLRAASQGIVSGGRTLG
jgi:Leucine rich repeat